MKVSDTGNDENKRHSKKNSYTFSLGVRNLVDYVYRHGGIKSRPFFESENIPSSIHSKYINAYKRKNPDARVLSEYTLKTEEEIENILFSVNGRADIIRKDNNSTVEIIEIKGIFGEGKSLPERVDILHASQAKIYGYLYCKESNVFSSSVKITVSYVSAISFEVAHFSKQTTFKELSDFFYETCKQFLGFFSDIEKYRKLRDESILSLKFPYQTIRDGQKDFMNKVLDSIKTGTSCLIQAPTGIGKTVSALYPAIKAIPRKYSDYIFYLTAKNSTQNVALETLRELKESGLIIKCLKITAKEKICLQHDIYCDTGICPYAINYYDKSGQALKKLLKYDFLDADIIVKVAEEYNVCPFEISLDASLFCDVIICDYNYIFDPKVKLARFVNDDANKLSLLVDESHNLPSRANEMHSADLTYSSVKAVYDTRKYLGKETILCVENLFEYFKNAENYFNTELDNPPFFDKSIPGKDSFRHYNTCASRKIPLALCKLIREFLSKSKPDLDRIENHDIKKTLQTLFFEANFFLRVCEEFFDESYILFAEKQKNNIVISVKCLNSSKMICSVATTGKHSSVFFSATLQPCEYFRKLICSPGKEYDTDFLILPSPFPSENLWVGAITGISVKYSNRSSTLSDVAKVVLTAVSQKKGNYLIYSPSFEYMESLHGIVTGTAQVEGLDIIRQGSNMNEKQRNMFIEEFKKKRNKGLLAFAVIGGIFAEGIDLVGENLSGAIIIGTGIPPNNTFNEILKDYYSFVFGNGYDFAYRFPGFNRVLQAAGRVIRTENDRGFVLIIDERYNLPEYKALFPSEWNMKYIEGLSGIKNELESFFTE